LLICFEGGLVAFALAKSIIDALKVSPMAFLRMVPNRCFSASRRKRAAFAARSDLKIVHAFKRLGCIQGRDGLIEQRPKRLSVG
jgi:hypothetical protein